VTIGARAEGKELTVWVSDTGVGIDAADLPHIFDRFYRADPSRNKEVAGSGLGLSFVKWIIENHDGSVRVSSALNHGSTFTIRLPRVQTAL